MEREADLAFRRCRVAMRSSPTLERILQPKMVPRSGLAACAFRSVAVVKRVRDITHRRQDRRRYRTSHENVETPDVATNGDAAIATTMRVQRRDR
jgi:hypothetical protein